ADYRGGRDMNYICKVCGTAFESAMPIPTDVDWSKVPIGQLPVNYAPCPNGGKRGHYPVEEKKTQPISWAQKASATQAAGEKLNAQAAVLAKQREAAAAQLAVTLQAAKLIERVENAIAANDGGVSRNRAKDDLYDVALPQTNSPWAVLCQAV